MVFRVGVCGEQREKQAAKMSLARHLQSPWLHGVGSLYCGVPGPVNSGRRQQMEKLMGHTGRHCHTQLTAHLPSLTEMSPSLPR